MKLTPIFLVVLFIIIIYEALDFDKVYDGWSIHSNKILLKRFSLIKGLEEIELYYKDIGVIRYTPRMFRRPLMLDFRTSNKKYIVHPYFDIFQLATTLKFFHEKEILIDFRESDEEIRLYIEGKIKSIPMTNDMKINN